VLFGAMLFIGALRLLLIPRDTERNYPQCCCSSMKRNKNVLWMFALY